MNDDKLFIPITHIWLKHYSPIIRELN